jgi:hypothetical protein
MKHVLPRLPRSGKAVFATLSARVGSIGDNRLGGWYSYGRPKRLSNNSFGLRPLNWPVDLQMRFASPCIPALSPQRYPLPSRRQGWSPSSLDGGAPSPRCHRSTRGGRQRRFLRSLCPADTMPRVVTSPTCRKRHAFAAGLSRRSRDRPWGQRYQVIRQARAGI